MKDIESHPRWVKRSNWVDVRFSLKKKRYEDSLVSLWKGERVIIRLVDLRPLKRRSIMKADDLEGRGIRSKYRSRRSNHYKSSLHFSLYFFLLLLTNLVTHYPYSHSKLNAFSLFIFWSKIFKSKLYSESTNSPIPLSAFMILIIDLRFSQFV